MAPFEFKKRFWTDQPWLATIMQLLIIPGLLVASLIFTLVAIGVFSNQYDHKVNNKYYCFIYLSESDHSSESTSLLPGDPGVCKFVIVGHSLVAFFLLLGLLIGLPVTMFIRPRSKFIIGFLVIVVFVFMLAFVSSIVLTFGFIADIIVRKVDCTRRKGMQLPACSETPSYLYDVFPGSTICSWIVTFSLMAIGILLAYVYLSITRQSVSSKSQYIDLV